jgi:lysozyme
MPWYIPLLFKRKQKPMILGIDISHHQGVIFFSEVVKDPQDITYVFIKATEGQTYVDGKLRYNSTEASKAGLKIGYYHFATLNTHNIINDAIAEANFFVDTIEKHPKPNMPLVLDIETNKAGLSPDQVELWVRSFFIQLERRGYDDYLLYSYTPFLNANLPANHDLGNIRLWIAAYVNMPSPRLPRGWLKYYIWQYSAKGRVKGIVGDVDMNRFNV